MGGSDRSASSFGSMASSRFSLGRQQHKFELKKRFYEKLEDFKSRVLLHQEDGMVVFRARCVYSGAVVALKGYSREMLVPQTRERIYNEVQTLQISTCPFILKCFDAFEDHGWWWLVLENCAAGDLFNAMQSSGNVTEEGWLVTQVLLPLLQTLAYLHNEGIIHRDIKPENLLFNSEKVTKLSGFLLATDVTRYGYPKDLVGTLDYVAPEVLILNNPAAKDDIKLRASYPEDIRSYDQKVDIWQVGILTYDVLLGHPPFESDAPEDTVSGILYTEPEFPDWLSADALSFLKAALSKHAEERPTARQLLSHPWVRAHLNWEPPSDFIDPIPAIDYRYYQEAGDDDSDVDQDSTMDDWNPNRRQWYDPRTWELFKAKDPEQDLAGTGPGRNANFGGFGAKPAAGGPEHVITVGSGGGAAAGGGGGGWLSWMKWGKDGGAKDGAAGGAGGDAVAPRSASTSLNLTPTGAGMGAGAGLPGGPAGHSNKVAPEPASLGGGARRGGLAGAGGGSVGVGGLEMEGTPRDSSGGSGSGSGSGLLSSGLAGLQKHGASLKEVPVRRISDDGLDTVQPMPPSGPPPAPAPAPGHALPVKPGAGTSGVVPALQLTKLPLMATPQSIQAADEEMQMLSARSERMSPSSNTAQPMRLAERPGIGSGRLASLRGQGNSPAPSPPGSARSQQYRPGSASTAPAAKPSPRTGLPLPDPRMPSPRVGSPATAVAAPVPAPPPGPHPLAAAAHGPAPTPPPIAPSPIQLCFSPTPAPDAAVAPPVPWPPAAETLVEALKPQPPAAPMPSPPPTTATAGGTAAGPRPPSAVKPHGAVPPMEPTSSLAGAAGARVPTPPSPAAAAQQIPVSPSPSKSQLAS